MASDSSVNRAESLDPVLTQATQGPSPIEEQQDALAREQGIRQRLAKADASGPTIRQRTQSEIIDLSLLQSRLANPYSTRWIPFEQLREMTTDLMLAFGWWMTITPLIRAEWKVECVAEGQRVIMADGTLKAIEDVSMNDLVLSSDGMRVTPDRVLGKIRTGYKEVLKIRLRDGRVLRVTDGHRMFCWNRWVEAKDLQVGDPISVARRITVSGVTHDSVTPDEALLIAFWLAEGSKTKPMFEVAQAEHNELCQRAAAIASRRGWIPKRFPHGLRICSAERRYNGDTPMNFLRRYGCWGQRTETLSIPEVIMSAPLEVVDAFLGAYVAADGCVAKNGVLITTISETLARDLQVLWGRYGVLATIQGPIPKIDAKNQWVVKVHGTDNLARIARIDFLHKDAAFRSLLNTSSLMTRDRSFPPEWLDEISCSLNALRKGGANPRHAWSSERTVRISAEIDDNVVLRNLLDGGLGWVAIESIERDGKAWVYDLETELHHAFFLEGGLAHNCPNAQLAAAVDEALRPVIAAHFLSFSNALWYGHQPLVKRFYLGKLGGTYRNPQGADPEQDLPVWDSSADVLLWKPPATLNPSHCLPMWDDDGGMMGFKFSQTPIPHFDLISATSAYGYEVIPGHEIGPDYAMWISNEAELNFGSVFGSARTKRAYPYWWSYWFRWRLADRSYENLADPAKIVYYPVDFDQFIDPDDPNAENPQVRQARQTALELGSQTRSGATLAMPGSMVEGLEGKSTGQRKWEISYLESKNNFSELDSTFKLLDVLKLRSWFLPEQAFVEGTGGRTAGGSAGGTGGARMATQLGQVMEESQQLLLEQFDAQINEMMIPQFIAANFPEKVGIPCRKNSRALGVLDDQTRSQVLQLIGQVRGEVLPVDTRELLRQLNVPLLNEEQMKREIQQIADLAAVMQPPEGQPEKVGTQGYNAGVMKTEKGNFYYQAPERIVLAESDGFMNSLPDTPHYRDAGVRSAVVRLRRLILDRYQQQYDSLVSFLKSNPTLQLAEDTQKQSQGQNKKRAAAAATALLAHWATTNANGSPGHASQAVTTDLGEKMAGLVKKIALSGGSTTLKSARLQAEDFGEGAIDEWVQNRVKFALDSIDQTVRDEVGTFLRNELQKSTDPDAVAKLAEEHFSGFPVTHADRVVRTEVRDAYNRGALEALHLAGVSQVQAHDASDGKDSTTDAECLQRQGRVYSVQEAMSLDEHPNGTLWWEPLSTENLSVERVEKLPAHLASEGRSIAYDERTETLYLMQDIDEQVERACLVMLGDQLAMR